MKIHEYQAKRIFKSYGIPIPNGDVASSPQEAKEIAKKIGAKRFIIKAQIHAGGRGKSGGIQFADSPSDVEKISRSMIGSRLVTPQTGVDGKQINRVLVEEAIEISKELYLGITIDRKNESPVIISSKDGGMEIEELAMRSPQSIIKEWVDIGFGLRPFQISKIFYSLDLDPSLKKTTTQTIANLYRLFIEKDCSLAEINPLVITPDGTLIALDAKINFDDNALSRQKEVLEMRDTLEEEPLEVEASKYNLNYIKMDGNIGCMVNGAGLAMATMDVIKIEGGKPANFLDIGGGATVEMVKNGLKILLSDPNVKGIWINIFGGILRCDTLAKGLIEAAREVKIDLPLVIRMEGTNVDLGRKMLNESGLKLIVSDTMREAAKKIIELTK